MPRQISGQHLFVATVDGVPGDWRTAERPSRSAETREEYDGGSQRDPMIISSRPTHGELTVSRGYDPREDQAQLRRLTRLVGSFRTTVKVIDIDDDFNTVGEAFVYAGVLREVSPPGTDANGTDSAMWSLVFHVSQVD